MKNSNTNSIREFKGKSLMIPSSDYTVIDLETTGFSLTMDHIIELSALRVRNNIPVDSFSSLVKSSDLPVLPSFAIDFTGITQEMYDSAPMIEDVFPEFISFVGDDIIVGHNVNFDIDFLYDYSMRFLNKPVTNDFIDTLRISRRLHPELPSHRLFALNDYYDLKSKVFHRALDDCKTTHNCLQALIADVLSKYDSFESFAKPARKSYLPAKGITATTNDFDELNPLYGKVCAFTGALSRYSRKEAMQLIVDRGGAVADGVTKKTNFLIVPDHDYVLGENSQKSSKRLKAEKLKISGNDIEIIPESVFYDMISD